MSLEVTRQDDTTIDTFDLTVERGVDSDVLDLKILNNGAEDVVGAYVVLYGENDPGSGLYNSSGHPVTDERMGRFQITGQNTDATPGQEIVLGVVQPLGHLAVAQLPIIKPGDWILANFWLSQAGSSAGGGSVNVKLEVAGDTASFPLPGGVTQAGTGIDSGRKQPISFHIGGSNTTATGSPDDQVHVAAGSWVIKGEEQNDPSVQDVTLDQTDGSAASLGVGEAYVAILTRDNTGALNTTKGDKDVAVDAVRPTPPAGELLVAWVTVAYNAVASVIQNSDIEDARQFGRYLVAAPPTGLTCTVFPGVAMIDSFRTVKQVPEVLTLLPSTVSRLWLEFSGAINVNTSDIPPSPGAIMLSRVTTDGSNVTSIVDTRYYISPAGPLCGGVLAGGHWSSETFTEEITTSANPSDSVASLLPAGSIVQAVTARVLSALTGSLSDFSVGDDSGSADTRFVSSASKAVDTTAVGLDNGKQAAAAKIRIKPTSGTLTGGVVRVVVHALVFTPPAY